MRLRLQFLMVGVRDLATYTVRSGRWWFPLLLLALGMLLPIVAATKTVVPTAVYTLF